MFDAQDHMNAIDIAYNIMRRQLQATFSHEYLKKLTLVCIPASSHKKIIHDIKNSLSCYVMI